MINVGLFLFDCLLHLPPLKANTLDTADKPINKLKTNITAKIIYEICIPETASI